MKKQNKRVFERSQKTAWEKIKTRGKGKLWAFMVQKKRSLVGVGIQGREGFVVT